MPVRSRLVAGEVGVVRQDVDQLADRETVVELRRHGDVTSAALSRVGPGPRRGSSAYNRARHTDERAYPVLRVNLAAPRADSSPRGKEVSDQFGVDQRAQLSQRDASRPLSAATD